MKRINKSICTKTQYTSRNNTETFKNHLITSIITAVITAVLTTILTLFIVNYQLSKEQVYWNKRFNIEKNSRIVESKIELFETINHSILIAELKARECKISTREFLISVKLDSIANFEEMATKRKKMDESYIEYNQHIFKLYSHLQLATFYFSDSFNLQIIPIAESLKENMYHNNNVDSLLNLPLEQLYSINDSSFATINELTQNRLHIIELMFSEIQLEKHNLLE